MTGETRMSLAVTWHSIPENGGCNGHNSSTTTGHVTSRQMCSLRWK